VSERNGNAAGWIRTTLDEIGTLYCGQSPPSKAVNGDGKGTVYITGPEQWDGKRILIDKWTTDPRRIVPDGCIFITVKGAGVGTIFPGIASAIGRDIYAYYPSESVSPSFIRYTLHATIDMVKRQAKGDIPGLTKDHLLKHEVGLPPLAEQRRIVAKIEAFQERSRRAREALSEVAPLLEQFRQSVLATAFRGDLSADWRAAHPNVEPASEILQRIRAERRRLWEQAELAKYEAQGQSPPKNWKEKYKGPESVDGSGLPELPDGWCWASLEELKDLSPNSMTDGPFGSKLKTSHYSDSGIRVVRLGNIGVGHFNADDEAFIPQSRYEELRKHEIFAGDLVIAALAEPVGRCCKIPPSIGKAIVKADCIRFRPHPSVLPEIVMHWLNSGTGRKLAEMASHGIGRLRINMENLRSLPVALPPVDEQIEIVASIAEQLAGIAQIEEQVGSCHEDLDQLDQSILAKAFRGELVPQNPSDELASVLLERIRAQRGQQAEATKKTSKTQRRSKMREKSSDLTSQRRPLVEILTTKDQPMPPEQLLTEAGYDDASIEDFYLALREEIAKGFIREDRPSEGDVMLEAVNP
jgi:type I restriction enzyme, S subunit